MSRIRSLKPEFWTDEDLGDLPRDARLLYAGLWNLADEHARLRGRADYIKGQLFPYDDDLDAPAVDALLKMLIEIGKAVRYTVDGRTYLHLPNLGKHSRLEPDRVPSKLPPPPAQTSPPAPRPARDADESARDADESESGARSNSLLYGIRDPSSSSLWDGDGARARPRASGATAFDRFWAAYPRREAKGAARKAWDKAINRAEPDAIIAGAERYRDDAGRDPKFTAHAATWLNADRWTDEATQWTGVARASPNGLVERDGLQLTPRNAALHDQRARYEAMDRAAAARQTERPAIGGPEP